MSVTPSNMLPLGTTAPDFSLLDTVSGKRINLEQMRGRAGTLVMFLCNHCPYVKHVNPELVRLAKDYEARGVNCIAICSNDAQAYPEDAPEQMKEAAQELGYPFPYLHDETQAVAKAYLAACTPDFFLFDADEKLVYRGRLDGSTPGNDVPLTGHDLRRAIEALLAGKAIDAEQLPSMGCNIKWRDE